MPVPVEVPCRQRQRGVCRAGDTGRRGAGEDEEGAPAGPDPHDPSLQHKELSSPQILTQAAPKAARPWQAGPVLGSSGRGTGGRHLCRRGFSVPPFCRCRGSGIACCLILRGSRSFVFRHTFAVLASKASLHVEDVLIQLTITAYFLCVSAEYHFLYFT